MAADTFVHLGHARQMVQVSLVLEIKVGHSARSKNELTVTTPTEDTDPTQRQRQREGTIREGTIEILQRGRSVWAD